MVKAIEKHVKTIATLSEDNQYRYMLFKEWDENLPNAAIVMLNPSKADMLKNDKTVMNVNNFLIDESFGSMTVVNLFAYRDSNPKNLKYKDAAQEELNNNYLIDAFAKAEVIIIAWTRNDYKIRKKEVEYLLKSYKNNVKCFEDKNGKSPRHPRDLGEGWKLTEYNFEYI